MFQCVFFFNFQKNLDDQLVDNQCSSGKVIVVELYSFSLIVNITFSFCFSKGYFIQPTIIESKDPKEKLMTEEIFGPVLTVYVYPDSKVDETLTLLDTSTAFALTGAIFGQDQ